MLVTPHPLPKLLPRKGPQLSDLGLLLKNLDLALLANGTQGHCDCEIRAASSSMLLWIFDQAFDDDMCIYK